MQHPQSISRRLHVLQRHFGKSSLHLVFLTILIPFFPVDGFMTVLVVRCVQTVIARMQIRRLLIILAGLAVHIEKDFFSTIIHTKRTSPVFVMESTMASGQSLFRRFIASSKVGALQPNIRWQFGDSSQGIQNSMMNRYNFVIAHSFTSLS
jgi:hypothetical protein